MKFLHMADLHIGKRVNEFSMIEDQKYILIKILNIIDEQEVECVLISGDVYDKPVPSAEAVQLVDNFLTKLAKRNLQVFVISGNHDSPERIGFGSKLMEESGVHMSRVFNGTLQKTTLSDEYGKINIFMMPFIKPAYVKNACANGYMQNKDNLPFESYNDAMKLVMNNVEVDTDNRNILLAHQFVTGAKRCESEDISVGGIDNVDASNFEKFDYVALGHIHGPQKVRRETIRYSGTPLKYSFSEADHNKAALIVNIKEKGNIKLEAIKLEPKNDMREIKGTYLELTGKEFYKDTKTDDYLHITLTDEDDIPEAIGKLRSIYPNIMKLDYDNKRTRANREINDVDKIEQKSPMELFEEFFELRNNQKMSGEQKKFSQKLIEDIWEEE